MLVVEMAGLRSYCCRLVQMATSWSQKIPHLIRGRCTQTQKVLRRLQRRLQHPSVSKTGTGLGIVRVGYTLHCSGSGCFHGNVDCCCY